MTVSVGSPADLANNAITRLGYRLKVGTLLDGSDHADVILQVYAQTRDDMLRNADYDFSLRTVALTKLKEGPASGYFPPTQWDPATMPPPNFLYEYAYPDDAIKIRSVRPQPSFMFNPAPVQADWTESNDGYYSPSRRVILCNIPDALASYTGRITDPALWDVAFVEAFAAALARRIGPSLVSLDAAKVEGADEQMETALSLNEGR